MLQNGSLSGLIQDLQLTMEHKQMAVRDPNTQEASPAGTASLGMWIKQL